MGDTESIFQFILTTIHVHRINIVTGIKKC